MQVGSQRAASSAVGSWQSLGESSGGEDPERSGRQIA